MLADHLVHHEPAPVGGLPDAVALERDGDGRGRAHPVLLRGGERHGKGRQRHRAEHVALGLLDGQVDLGVRGERRQRGAQGRERQQAGKKESISWSSIQEVADLKHELVAAMVVPDLASEQSAVPSA